MKQAAILVVIVLFVVVAFTLNRMRHATAKPHIHLSEQAQKTCPQCCATSKKVSVAQLKSVPYLEHYIEEVIIHGSKQKLGFKYGDMPEKMADPALSPKIAAYVVTLSGKKPTHPEWVREGRLYYTSNCGGCHGEDGKGVHGTFPDLTRDPLLGIEKHLRKVK